MVGVVAVGRAATVQEPDASDEGLLFGGVDTTEWADVVDRSLAGSVGAPEADYGDLGVGTEVTQRQNLRCFLLTGDVGVGQAARLIDEDDRPHGSWGDAGHVSGFTVAGCWARRRLRLCGRRREDGAEADGCRQKGRLPGEGIMTGRAPDEFLPLPRSQWTLPQSRCLLDRIVPNP